MVREELEQKYGATLRGIIERRTAAGHQSIPGERVHMVWEVTRVLTGLPDDGAVVAWLEDAVGDEAGPILAGYEQLCRAVEAGEADAIARARLALAAESFPLACCHFAAWWYDTHLAHYR